MFDGRETSRSERSGLTHEQETVLMYVSEPQSIQGILQITRYDELDTCKVIADLLEMGLLEVSQEQVATLTPAWGMPSETQREIIEPAGPSPWFWPLVAVLMLAPLFLYVPHSRGSLNLGLGSLQPFDVHVATDSVTRERQAYVLQMVAPADGGKELSRRLGISGGEERNPLGDFRKMPDPLFESAP